jgi:hypothetical protein
MEYINIAKIPIMYPTSAITQYPNGSKMHIAKKKKLEIKVPLQYYSPSSSITNTTKTTTEVQVL